MPHQPNGVLWWKDYPGAWGDIISLYFSKSFITVSHHNTLTWSMDDTNGQWDDLESAWIVRLKGLWPAASSSEPASTTKRLVRTSISISTETPVDANFLYLPLFSCTCLVQFFSKAFCFFTVSSFWMNTYLHYRIKNKGPSLKKRHLHHTDAIP